MRRELIRLQYNCGLIKPITLVRAMCNKGWRNGPEHELHRKILQSRQLGIKNLLLTFGGEAVEEGGSSVTLAAPRTTGPQAAKRMGLKI